jgi:hypothetical protein
VPTENTDLISRLASIYLIGMLFSGAISTLYNVFLITNNLKVNSIFWALISVVDVLIVFMLLNVTNLGVYAVAGVSRVVGATANLVFVPIYAAYCLNIKKSTFYPVILRYTATSIFIMMIFFCVKRFLPTINNWFGFLCLCLVMASLGMMINLFLLFKKNERVICIQKLKSLLKIK